MAKLGIVLLLLSALAAMAQSQAPTGSNIANTAYVSYTDTTGKAFSNIPSNEVLVTVAKVTAATLTQSQNIPGTAGGAVLLQHHLSNVGNTMGTYYVAVNGQPVSDFSLTGLAIYFDANNNGKVDPGETALTPTTPVQLSPGQIVSLLVVGTIPSTATVNQKTVLQVTATDTVNPVLTNTDTVTVNSGPGGGGAGAGENVQLQKSASASSATPGQSVQFTLQMQNFGTGDAAPVGINIDGQTQQLIYLLDPIPANTQFASVAPQAGTVFYHQIGTPAAFYTQVQPPAANIDYIGFGVTALPAGQGIIFQFSVTVDQNASGSFTNTATVTSTKSGQTVVTPSNTVTVSVPVVPPTISYYRDTTFTQTASVVSISGTVHIQAVAAACNADPTVVEKHLITVTTNQTHDVEQFMAVETGPNTGVFQVQSVQLKDAPAVQEDGILEVYKNEILTATITGCGGSSASAEATILVDPFGVLFDSHSDKPVPGSQVTLIDVTGQGNGGHPGQPATVLKSDYTTTAPSTVTTGSDGSYQFPVVSPSTYKLSVVPSLGYNFPSKVTPAKLPPDRTIVQPGSYGGSFVISSTTASVNFDVPLDPGPTAGFFVAKQADEPEAEAGSLVGYTIQVTNNTGQDLPNAKVFDLLPPGFLYQLKSAKVDSKPVADPLGGRGPSLTFAIGDVAAGSTVTLHYFVRLMPRGNINSLVNTAYAVSGSTRSNTAAASIRIIGGVFDTKGVIIGKVYADCNENGQQDANEPGIPGVRIYLDNGTYAVTDSAGQYSIFAVTARLHGVKLDNYSLPKGFEPVPISVRNAGDGGSRFVDMIAGELHRADFAVRGCSEAAIKELAERRHEVKGGGETAIINKAPVLDRTFGGSIEQRRATTASGVLDGGGSTGAAGSAAPAGMATVSGSGITPATPGTESPVAPPTPAPGNAVELAASAVAGAAPTAPAAAPDAASPAAASSTGAAPAEGAPAAASETAPAAEGEAAEAGHAQDESEMKNGLKVIKLIKPGMTNDFGFIGLADGQNVPGTQLNVALKGVLGTSFELYVNGQRISPERIAQKSTKTSSNLQAWLYLGMDLHPGKNLLEARMFDPFGNERGMAKIYVTAPGALAKIFVEPATRVPVADGKTPVPVLVRLADADGVPVTERTPVTLETTIGKWDATDLDPKQPGTQVFVEGGHAIFELKPPMEPSDGKIAASSGTFNSEAKLSFMPDLRPLMAIGVLEQTLSFRHFSGSNAQRASYYTLQNDTSRMELTNGSDVTDYQAHIGTLMKGRVWGDTLLTLSYDSDKQSGDPMFRDSQPDDYYLVYGDSSVRGYDAQSTSRLYLRLDRGKNYIMYGDYNTGDSQNAAKVLSNINRSFTGLRLHQQGDHYEFTGYTTHDSVKQYVEEIPANGSSGPYLVSRIDLVLNSQTVEILVRDRNQPALILKSTPMAQMVDYEFDALTGSIIFKQPIASFDSSMNPQSIRVTYEFTSGGPRYWMSGIDGSVHTDKLRLGGTLYDDKTPSAGMRLYGTNGTYAFSKDAIWVGEWARTWTPTLGTGDGYHTEFKDKTATLDSRLYYGHTGVAFDNPNAMLNQGRGEAGANITWKVQAHTRLHFEMIRSEAVDTGASQTGIYTTIQRDLTQLLSAEFGYRHAGAVTESTSATNTVTTTTTTKGTTTTNPVNGEPQTPATNNVSTPANEDLYLKMSMKFRHLKKLSIYGEYEDDMSNFTKRELALGGTYQFSSKGKFYIRHELISSLGNLYQLNGQQQQNSTVIGIDTTYLKNDRVFTEYRGEDAFSGRETEMALGLRNAFMLRPGLRMTATMESVKTLSGTATNNAFAITGALEYTRPQNWKSSGRFEWRQSSSSDAILSSYGLAIKLNDSYTLLNRSIYALTIPKSSGQTDRLQIRVQNGISYRPKNSNRFSTLIMLELKEEKDGTVTVAIPNRKVFTGVAAANYLVTPKLTLSTRYATKFEDDKVVPSDSTFDGHMVTGRLLYDLNRKWSTGVDFSALYSDCFNNVHYARGLEIGRVMRQNLWLSVGYNITGVYDRDLTGDESTRQGPFVRLRFKWDEAAFPFLKREQSK